jgi:Fic family protein
MQAIKASGRDDRHTVCYNTVMLTNIIKSVEEKKAELDRLRPRDGLSNLEHSHDLELTYTSNAIEGNTLTAAETTLVIEQGITVGGKPLKDHLEAVDHYEAIRYVRERAKQTVPLAPQAAFDAHRRLVDMHPFDDGNGRTARLLMNLILIRGGYPPVAVRPEDRPAYVGASNTLKRSKDPRLSTCFFAGVWTQAWRSI